MVSWERILHRLMRRLPVGPASALGGKLAQLKIRFISPDVAEKARLNLRRHLPGASEAEIERMLWRFAENIGRVMAEFAISHRFAETGRIEMLGVEEASAMVGQMPTIALCLHLGNWEVVASALQVIGVPIASISEIPDDPLHREIADATRKGFGVNVLAPNRNGARHALALLRNNGTVAIFPDEMRDGRMMAPLFGRPPHLKGNLAVAAKLARRTGAQIVLGYCERVDGTRFRVHFLPPYALPPGESDPLTDVALLNGLIEPIILKHLDQWYYLDDSVAPIDPVAPPRAEDDR